MKKDFIIDKEQNIAVHTGKGKAMSEAESRLIALANGAAPLNDSEEKLQEDISKLEKNNIIVEIPAM
ncbi:MAG TPA: hypothetical protein VK484_10500 [Ferruginibacter sp.]|nr:hypothetical protein [Ferruginibacter sp.]